MMSKKHVAAFGQSLGGQGKSLFTSAAALQLPTTKMLELEVVARQLPLFGADRVTWFALPAHEEIAQSAGQAALAAFDAVVQAIIASPEPALLVDLAATTALPFFSSLKSISDLLVELEIEIAVVVPTTAEAASVAETAALLDVCRGWTRQFAIENRRDGIVDAAALARAVGDTTITIMPPHRLEPDAATILKTVGLAGIDQLNIAAMRDQFGALPAARLLASLQRLKRDAMLATALVADWVAGE